MLLGCALAAQSKRSITETDLFQFTWIGDPQVSPDGASIAFVRVSVNAKKDGYDTALYVVATAGDAPPTAAHDGATRFVAAMVARRHPPRIHARTRNRTANGCRHSSILLSMRGGEPAPLTDLPKGAGEPEMVPGWHAHRLQERDVASQDLL